MYAPGDEEYFCNYNSSNNTESILPAVELMVNFRLDGGCMKKPCVMCAEKIAFRGLLVRFKMTKTISLYSNKI